jgi:ribosome-associated protein YbcJ (S4-like RNA binding protein)/antitoxin component of MazEF toxin-antitoxin module
MLSTTVNNTGQITLPEAIRQHLKLVSGSQVEFVIDEEGQVKFFSLNVAVENLSGILYRPGLQRASLEDMETAMSEGANDWKWKYKGKESMDSSTIKLDQFLKFLGIAPTGGQAKLLIQEGEVQVNDEIETRRGRKLSTGDRVTINNQTFSVDLSDRNPYEP